LFSFIDVLGGLIGALSLIIIGVSLSQVVPESLSASPLASPMRVLESEIHRKSEAIEKLQESLAQRKAGRDELQDAQEELAVLTDRMNRQTDRESYLAQTLAEIGRLRARIAQLQESRDRLRQEVSRLEETVREDRGTVGRDRIEVHFAGRGLNLKPVFVECTPDGLVIREQTQMKQVHWRSISDSDEFSQLMGRVKATPGGSIVFLVRPDGIRSFNLASAEVDKRQVRNGKLPIPGQGDLDLGQYEKGTDEEPDPGWTL